MEEIKLKINSMNLDTSPSLVEGTLAIENMNLRFTPTKDGGNFLSITNEKGTKEITINYTSSVGYLYTDYHILGTVLGYAVVLNYLVVFSTRQTVKGDYYDYITILLKELNSDKSIESFTAIKVCYGNFGFNIKNPIETLVNIERSDLLKVYWVDGINPLRMLIVADVVSLDKDYIEDSEYFDAIRSIVPPLIEITKESSGGTFPVGTIQYACTYYSTFKGESNLCYLSSIQYLSHDNGLAADKSCNCSFTLTIKSIDLSYDYLRVYSIIRTALNGTPQVKLVSTISTKDISLYSPSTGKSEVPKGRKIVSRESIRLSDRSYRSSELDYTKWGIMLVTLKKTDTGALIKKGSIGFETLADLINANSFSITIPYYSVSSNDGIGVIYLNNMDEIHYPQAYDGTKKHDVYNFTLDRTSDNALYLTIEEEWVITEDTPQSYFFIDNGTTGEGLTDSKLLYVGGQRYVPSCISLKDDTLFLGNYTISTVDHPQITLPLDTFSFDYRSTLIKAASINTEYYSYNGQLSNSSDEITTFKAGETYRIGILFQDKYGTWSSPMFIGDYKQSKYPSLQNTGTTESPKYNILCSLIVEGKYVLSSDVISTVISLGFIKARPLVVFPQEGEQEVLFQGVANCTLLKGYTDTNYTITTALSAYESTDFDIDYNTASWFFRPVVKDSALYNTSTAEDYGILFPIGKDFRGVPLQYQHQYIIPLYFSAATESADIKSSYTHLNSVKAEFLYNTRDWFRIDWSTITIDSPDLKFNEDFLTLDLTNTAIRIVGYTEPVASRGSYYLDVDGSFEYPEECVEKDTSTTSSVNYQKWGTFPFGNNLILSSDYLSRENYDYGDIYYGGVLINYPLWVDAFSDNGLKKHNYHFATWNVFPWNRTGALNNCLSDTLGNLEVLPETLKRKFLANLKYTVNTTYTNPATVVEDLNKLDIKVFLYNSADQIARFADGSLYRNELDLVMPAQGVPSYNLYAEVTSPISDSWRVHSFVMRVYDPLDSSWTSKASISIPYILLTMYNRDSNNYMRYNNPIEDSLTDSTPTLELEAFYKSNNAIPVQFKTGNNCVAKLGDNLLDYFRNYGYPIVEVYRTVDNKFGGTSLTALENNQWIIAGDSVDLVSDKDATLYYTLGDTYYQRYDCLKTLPYNDTSKNNIIEILSFMCETRVNIDGRYDNNRGLEDNTNITNENFNLLNNVYSLRNNYFTYNITPIEESKINNYPNQVIWSLTKTQGDRIDAWLNNSLTSYINLDGDKGKVNAIKFFKDNLYVFQDSGISLLKYNQNVMVNSANGTPIEVTNSGKVTGAQYLQTESGCINKWAIAETPSALAYIDSYHKTLSLIAGEQKSDISTDGNMKSWFLNNIKTDSIWNPTFSSMGGILLYSKLNNELLYTDKDYCLAYNLTTAGFTSFYSYNAVPFLVNFNGNEFFLNKATDREEGDTEPVIYDVTKPWELNTGDYNNFFGTKKLYYTKFIANDTSRYSLMKVFDILEIRDNLYLDRDNDNNIKKQPFEYIEASNSYQSSGEVELNTVFNHHSLYLKSKFRVWRINIPRQGRLRMRDHYIELKLSSNINKDSYKVQIEEMKTLYT